MDEIEFLEKGFLKLNINTNKKAIDDLLLFKEILLEWNEKINLTSITDKEEIFIKHFFDSATCASVGYIKKDSKVIDIGTGAGFPGLVLKILNNDLKITLLDSLKKRTIYLKDVVSRLELKDVEIIHGRAEEYGNKKDYRQQYDIALSRAVASFNILLEYCIPFIKVGGFFICQKGPKAEIELKEAKKALHELGGKVVEVTKIPLPESDASHYIIIVEKVIDTPHKYPRRPGKPSLNPII